MLEGGITRQVCSLRSPVTPPPPSHHHTLTLGHINTVLVLEDHGPIGPSSNNTIVQQSLTSHHPGVAPATMTMNTVPQPTATQFAKPTSGLPSRSVDMMPSSLRFPQMTLSTSFTQAQSQAQPSHVVPPPSLPTNPSLLTQQQPVLPTAPLPQTVSQSHGSHPAPQLPPDVHIAAPTTVAASGGSHPMSQLPPNAHVAAPTMVGSAEYGAAMELEMWKLTEEEAFQEHLKTREKTHMAKLGRM